MGNIFDNLKKSRDSLEDSEPDIFGWVFYNEERTDEIYTKAEIYTGKGNEAALFIGAGDKTVFGIESSTGETLWRYVLETDKTLVYPILLRGDNIYLLTRDRLLQVLSIEFRNILWDKRIEFPLKYVTPGEKGLLLCAAEEKGYYGVSKILAMSYDDGSVFWQKEIAVINSPVIEGDTVFLNTSAGFIYALSMVDGSVLWKHNMFLEKGAFDMVSSERSLYIAERELVYAMDAGQGTVRWKFKINGEICPEMMLHGENLFIITKEGDIYCLDIENGVMQWSFKGPPVNSAELSEGLRIKPFIVDRILCICRSDSLLGLDILDGTIKFSRELNSDTQISVPQPVAAGGNLFFTDGRRQIYWLDLKKLEVTGSYDLIEDPSGIAFLKCYSEMVYIMTRFGSVFCMNMLKSDISRIAQTLAPDSSRKTELFEEKQTSSEETTLESSSTPSEESAPPGSEASPTLLPPSKEKLPFHINAPIEPYFSSMDEVESEHWIPPVDESSSDDDYPAQNEAESREISAVEEKQVEEKQVEEKQSEAQQPPVKEAEPEALPPVVESSTEDLFPPLREEKPEALPPAAEISADDLLDLFPPLKLPEPEAAHPAARLKSSDLFPPLLEETPESAAPAKLSEPAESAEPVAMEPMSKDLFSFVKDIQSDTRIPVTEQITQDLFKSVQDLKPETLLPVVEAPAEESVLQKSVLDEIKDSDRNQIEDKGYGNKDSVDNKECSGGDDMISGISEIGNRSDNLDVLNGKLREIQEREARLEEKTAILGMHIEALKSTLERFINTRETSDSQLAQSIELLRQEMTKISGSLLVNNVPKMDMLMKHLSHVFKYVQYLSKEVNEIRMASGKAIQKPNISDDDVKH